MHEAVTRRRFLESLTVAGGLLAARDTSVGQSPAPQAATTAAPNDRIDIHVHLGRDQQEQFDPDRLRANVSAAARFLVQEMDKQRIERSLLVPVEPIMPTEVYLQAAREIPDRLMSACSVIPRPVNTALDLLKRHRDSGARALKLQPMQYDPRDPAVERVVAEAVGYGFPVLFHYTDLPTTFPAFLEHLATTFTAGNFVVIHFGGIYGFAPALPLAHSLPNVYLETSTAFVQVVQSPLRAQLHFLVQSRLNKLIFGTEHPRDYARVVAAIDDLTREAKDDVKHAIYRGNAARILKLA